ncbi:NEAT domain-containing protein [Paenibacillus sp. FSL H8-0537]|uniref:NEAT domain-containing protein n=1 Tax=Paenibacillus sp. FSL H8-0537 TaxID=2921399 RepID=UPI003100F143
MIKSFKKMMPLMLLVMAVALVVQVGSAFAATSLSFTVLKPDGTVSYANAYANSPASLASDNKTVTLSFAGGSYINSLSISNDGGATYTVVSATTLANGDKEFTFEVNNLNADTVAKIHVTVPPFPGYPNGYNTVHDIKFGWDL